MINWKKFESKQSWPNFMVQFQHLPGMTEENHEKPDGWSLGRDVNPEDIWVNMKQWCKDSEKGNPEESKKPNPAPDRPPQIPHRLMSLL
jgi:hypothetical protein